MLISLYFRGLHNSSWGRKVLLYFKGLEGKCRRPKSIVVFREVSCCGRTEGERLSDQVAEADTLPRSAWILKGHGGRQKALKLCEQRAACSC